MNVRSQISLQRELSGNDHREDVPDLCAKDLVGAPSGA